MAALPQKVLLVDDEPLVREQLQRLLVAWGYEVRVAADAEQAAAELDAWAPDIVLTDLVLPGQSGYTVLAHVQRRLPGTPVLIVTGYASLDGAIDALKQGAYDYLLKPVTSPELRAALDRASASVGLKREQARAAQLRHIAEVAMTLAHEINNPLAVMIGEMQLRLEADPSPDERRTLAICLESAQRIAATIRSLNELQDVSYEEYGDFRLLNLEPPPAE